MSAFCQVEELAKRIETLTEEKVQLKHVNDSLQRAASSIEGRLAGIQADTARLGIQLRSLQSQSFLIRQYQDSIDLLNKDIAALNKDITKKEKDIKNLDNSLTKEKKKNNTVKEEKAKLERQVNLLYDTIQLKNEAMAQLEQANAIAVMQAHDKGYADALKVIKLFFNNDFDLLTETVNRDMLNQYRTIVQDKAVQDRIRHLSIFLSAREALEQKYNKGNIDTRLRELATIPATPRVEALRTKLKDFQMCNVALKATLLDIQRYNKDMGVAVNEKESKTKRAKIMTYLSDYIYNYEFNFTDYPYLAGIVIEVMNAFYRDSDTDINGIINKL